MVVSVMVEDARPLAAVGTLDGKSQPMRKIWGDIASLRACLTLRALFVKFR